MRNRCVALTMEEFAHDGHLTATARETCANIPCHWYFVAIETASSPGDPGIIPGLSRLRDRPAPGLAPQPQALAPDAGARLLRPQRRAPIPPSSTARKR